MNINEEEVLSKVLAQIKSNIGSTILAQGGTEEDVATTLNDNAERIAEDAEKLASFFKEAFAE